MSIIYDALKKIEHSNNNDFKLLWNNKYIRQQNKPRPYLLFLLIIALGLFIYNNFTLSKRPPSLVSPIQTNVQFKPFSGQVLQQKEEQQEGDKVIEDNPKPIWVLNGVFSSLGKNYALINNQIVQEKDIIAGAIVRHIDLDSVELETIGGFVKITTVSEEK